MADTTIEWTDKTWNPVIGCSRVSAGCTRCYAERQAFRLAAMGQARYRGLTKKVGGEIRWTGKVRFVEEVLAQPLRWRDGRRIFVNSMSDLFHEGVTDEQIARVWWVMGQCAGYLDRSRRRGHTFQILTKRPERMLAWLRGWCEPSTRERWIEAMGEMYDWASGPKYWPDVLPNVHLGVSVEDQTTADERIPLLLHTPAAVRWVSYEPALGPVTFRWAKWDDWNGGDGHRRGVVNEHDGLRMLDWIVVGGESGPGARPFDVEWARTTIQQCRAADVPVFVKQLGAEVFDARLPHEPPWTLAAEPEVWRREWPAAKGFWQDNDGVHHGPILYDRKGGDWTEWPADLRVREFPKVSA